jgi:hypothetical protein
MRRAHGPRRSGGGAEGRGPRAARGAKARRPCPSQDSPRAFMPATASGAALVGQALEEVEEAVEPAAREPWAPRRLRCARVIHPRARPARAGSRARPGRCAARAGQAHGLAQAAVEPRVHGRRPRPGALVKPPRMTRSAACARARACPRSGRGMAAVALATPRPGRAQPWKRLARSRRRTGGPPCIGPWRELLADGAALAARGLLPEGVRGPASAPVETSSRGRGGRRQARRAAGRRGAQAVEGGPASQLDQGPRPGSWARRSAANGGWRLASGRGGPCGARKARGRGCAADGRRGRPPRGPEGA